MTEQAGPATDPLPIAQALIRCRSVTPADDGAIGVVEDALRPLGFACHRLRFGPKGEEIENLFARRGTGAPHFCWAGHTDVVPPGDEGAWTHDPFGGVVEAGRLYGRGAADMKGGIACMVAATLRFLAATPAFQGSIAFLITSDEEGPGIDGTVIVVEQLKARGEKLDWCIVGEPTSAERVEVRTQAEAPRAQPSVSAVSGGS